MVLTLSGCESLANNPSGSTNPSTSTTTASPSTPSGSTATIAALIARLEKASADASTNRDTVIALVEDYYASASLDTGSEEYAQLISDISQVCTNRIAALSDMICALQNIQTADTAAVEATVAEAEMLISQAYHSFVVTPYQNAYSQDTACTEREVYQICSRCNAIELTQGQHQWYYSRTDAGHQICCQMCTATESAVQHNLSEGKCSTCNYVVNANILVIEGVDGESAKLRSTIGSKHTLTVVNVADSENVPATLEALQAYHEVILCNVANADLPGDFAELLQSYVRDFGGTLFTVGGDKAYQQTDMATTYQDMLPVDIAMPSIAVMIIIDCSGSMWNINNELYEESKLCAAIQGTEDCLDELCENDYVGVIALADYYTETIELTPRPQRDKIVAAIRDLPRQGHGGTIFSAALERAGQALKAMTDVDKRHIILITDGEPSVTDTEMYHNIMQKNAAAGITTSIVGTQCARTAAANMKAALVYYAGMNEKHFYDVQDLSQVPLTMREDLNAPEIRDMNCQRYMPSIMTSNSITADIALDTMPVLDGAHYSKLKEGATEVLGSPYGPLYAQWNYGKGMVGSFMCDLNGIWSADLIGSEAGSTILNNIVSHLINAPTDDAVVPAETPDPVSAVHTNQPLWSIPTKKRW